MLQRGTQQKFQKNAAVHLFFATRFSTIGNSRAEMAQRATPYDASGFPQFFAVWLFPRQGAMT
ncbi:hypothetical protein GC1_20385 [Leisingera sp. ANG1]|nr:hypothetical protein RA23_11050 [Leisingera sp. ANG-S3]KIC52930.1 hypothetical protein RA22_12655 [Leisingera sp. ANG-S]KID07330.1 hypothetical protein GC1_20385 [Leisingera sp. ANG1]